MSAFMKLNAFMKLKLAKKVKTTKAKLKDILSESTDSY